MNKPLPMADPTRAALRARWRVNRAIHRGTLAPAHRRFCVDCGRRASEYDHFLGYAPEHALAVQPVCRVCHRRRTHPDLPGDCPTVVFSFKPGAGDVEAIDALARARGCTRSQAIRLCIRLGLQDADQIPPRVRAA